MRPLILAATLAALPLSAAADEIAATIRSALEACASRDPRYAAEELAYAQRLLRGAKAIGQTGLLPPAPADWTRADNTEMTANMGFMGGGVGARATCTNGTDRFEIMLMADNPMVAAMGGMFSNAAAMGIRQIRVGRERFADQDGQLTALIDNRVLVQASGASADVMMPVLERIDYAGLSAF